MSTSEWLFVPGGIRLAFWYTAPGGVDAQGLGSALARMVRRHPLLGARIAQSPGGGEFRPLGTEPLVAVRPAGTSLEEELTRASITAEPGLVHAAVLPGHPGDTLVVSLHHAIADGQSARAFATELAALRAAARATAPDAPRDTHSAPALPVPPPIEQLIDRRPHPEDELARYANRRHALARSADVAQLPHRSGVGRAGFAVGSVVADQASTAGLLNAARSLHVSLHALVCAAATIAVRRLSGHRSGQRVPSVCHMPVDMRRRLRIAPGTQCFASSGHHAVLELTADADPLAAGQEISRQLAQAVLDGGLEREILALPRLVEAAPLPISIGVTELGTSRHPHRATAPPTGLPLVPAPVPLAATSLAAGRLHIALPYFRQWYGDDLMRNLREEIHDVLRAAAGTRRLHAPVGSSHP
ncbi:hypothetical protein ACF059_30715 [Streptomyces sp. NPDC016562]|uniref:phthiocerol/phthiodiolone dimycocerosyl transferase family protein n=1 Tax=Streptomyces sp. NPDC016562 TaxID=3364966 RepID=UPI0036F730DB